MSNTSHHTTMKELLSSLEKKAPKSCSKPKSEMCSKCIARTSSEKAIHIESLIQQLKNLIHNNEFLNADLETKIINALNE